MIIDLDSVFGLLEPTIVVRLGGREHPLRVLTLADLERLGSLGEHSDAANRDYLAGLFVGEPPACVGSLGDASRSPEQANEDHLRVLTLVSAIAAAAARERSLPNRLARAVRAVRAQLEAAGTESSSA